MPICAIIQTTCSSAQNPWLVSNWLVSKCVCKESQKQVWGSFRDRGEAAISRHRPLWPMGNIDNTIMWKNDIECWTFLNKYRSKILHKSDEKVTSSSFQVSIFFWMITPCGLSCPHGVIGSPMPCPRLPNPYCDAMIASEIRRSACWTLEYSYIHIYIYMKVTHCHKCHWSFMSAKAGTDRCLFLFDIVMCTRWQCQTTLRFFFSFLFVWFFTSNNTRRARRAQWRWPGASASLW